MALQPGPHPPAAAASPVWDQASTSPAPASRAPCCLFLWFLVLFLFLFSFLSFFSFLSSQCETAARPSLEWKWLGVENACFGGRLGSVER